jgi:hypothetical protein
MDSGKGEKKKQINNIKEDRIYTFRPISMRDVMEEVIKLQKFVNK